MSGLAVRGLEERERQKQAERVLPPAHTQASVTPTGERRPPVLSAADRRAANRRRESQWKQKQAEKLAEMQVAHAAAAEERAERLAAEEVAEAAQAEEDRLTAARRDPFPERTESAVDDVEVLMETLFFK